MRIILVLVLLLSSFAFAKVNSKATAKEKKQDSTIEKVPKSIFLIKKAKINAAVGEPQFYPAEVQLRTVTHDQLLHSIKKYE